MNLGIIPGLGGTQRLPRIVGLGPAVEMLRTGRSVGAENACAMGWAEGPHEDVMVAAAGMLRDHREGRRRLAPVDPRPLALPDVLPSVDLGHHSLATDTILVEVLRCGLAVPLEEGLQIEAQGFARCKDTVDFDIGMKNFMQNGPRVPAVFVHE